MGETEPEIHIQPGKTNQRGANFKNGDIYLVKTPSQVDWRYVLPLDDSETENGLPIWGNLKHELEGFIEFSTDFLQNLDVLPLDQISVWRRAYEAFFRRTFNAPTSGTVSPEF